MSESAWWPENTAPPQEGGTHWVKKRVSTASKGWLFLQAPNLNHRLTQVWWGPVEDAGIWSQREAERLAAWQDGRRDEHDGVTEVRTQEIPEPALPQEPIIIRAEPIR
jgi:hypothetical protein